MSSYTISKTLNPKRVFILQKSELGKRFDPFFYVPELLELERKVLAKKPKKLRDYVVSVSSGATPKTTETELYYAEKENGIPFLRVQNLSPTGVLEFDDCKYINHETHNGMLKRSQVSTGDLLVKITGVGRMAIASVAPEGFIGNINQHVCVIKTRSKEISETLAAFLNSDIGEKLASRRSAGGTRPALDYPALLSIPIIEDKRILQITNKVTEQKQKNQAEAEKLLSSIDNYLLKELGITLPKETYYAQPEDFNNIVSEPKDEYGNYRFIKEKFELNQQSKLVQKGRIFIANLSEVTGSRLDPDYHNFYYNSFYKNLTNGNFGAMKLKNMITKIYTGKGLYDYLQNGIPYLNVNNIKKYEVVFENVNYVDGVHQYENIISKNQIITGRVGTIGNFAKYEKEFNALISDNVFALTLNKAILNIDYANYFLNSILSFIQLKRNSRGAVQEVISTNVLNQLQIPVPPLDKQKEIADHITDIRQKAQELKDKTKELLKKANEEIEEILLN